jgi:hypothetical protein
MLIRFTVYQSICILFKILKIMVSGHLVEIIFEYRKNHPCTIFRFESDIKIYITVGADALSKHSQ